MSLVLLFGCLILFVTIVSFFLEVFLGCLIISGVLIGLFFGGIFNLCFKKAQQGHAALIRGIFVSILIIFINLGYLNILVNNSHGSIWLALLIAEVSVLVGFVFNLLCLRNRRV